MDVSSSAAAQARQVRGIAVSQNRPVCCAAQLGVACHNASLHASHGARTWQENWTPVRRCCYRRMLHDLLPIAMRQQRAEIAHVTWSLCKDRSSISRGESGRPTRSFMTRWCKHACLAMLCAVSSV